jgi:two-component system chemotaxis sensor kinase CheA
MTLAGELVLSRNQLLQSMSSEDHRGSEIAGQRIDLITSELQEAIMLTRMQSIGNVFNKFPRVVRDLSQTLGKKVELHLEGKDVELDKTIIEAIGDPLTHLVRNAVDHGIELPGCPQTAGKNPVGQIFLKAYHEAGQVNIEISDDGKGTGRPGAGPEGVGEGIDQRRSGQGHVRQGKDQSHLSARLFHGRKSHRRIRSRRGHGCG